MINIPGKINPPPWKVCAFPTIRKPNRNKAALEKDLPNDSRILVNDTGNPFGNQNPVNTPNKVIVSTGLKKIDLTVVITTKQCPLKNRFCLDSDVSLCGHLETGDD